MCGVINNDPGLDFLKCCSISCVAETINFPQQTVVVHKQDDKETEEPVNVYQKVIYDLLYTGVNGPADFRNPCDGKWGTAIILDLIWMFSILKIFNESDLK